MPGEILLSTAYFPPSGYFSLIKESDKILIETQENYLKQTYRNRCIILSSGGTMNLSVPVMKTASPKTLVKDITIDYSKRWQQVHLRALNSSYNRSPYYMFYSESFEKIILRNHRFLLDLNNEILAQCLDILNIGRPVSFTSVFLMPLDSDNDYRYRITPKKEPSYLPKPYLQVFSAGNFIPYLSILDLIFNVGPGSADYI